MAIPTTAQTTATATAANQKTIADRERLANKKRRGLNDTAAHELGHVIGHIGTETYFSSVWVRGVNEWYDKQHDLTKMAGCVCSYQYGKMTFDGERVKCIAWGMQRPDKGPKMCEFGKCRSSLQSVWATAMQLREKTPSSLDVSDWSKLKEVFYGIDCISCSENRWTFESHGPLASEPRSSSGRGAHPQVSLR